MGEKRIKMALKLMPEVLNSKYKFERLESSNIEELASALIDAFIDTPDYEGESFLEAVQEIRSIIDGKYGEFVPEASGLIKQSREVASAIFISIYKGKPMITEVFTRKKYLGLGMGQTLIRNSSRLLLALGYEELILYCNPLNCRALKVYEKLGFVPAAS